MARGKRRRAMQSQQGAQSQAQGQSQAMAMRQNMSQRQGMALLQNTAQQGMMARQGIGTGEAGGGTQLQSPLNSIGRQGTLGMLAEKYSQGLANRKKKPSTLSLSQQAMSQRQDISQ